MQIQLWLTAAAMNIKKTVRTPTLLPAAAAAAQMALPRSSIVVLLPDWRCADKPQLQSITPSYYPHADFGNSPR